MSNNTSATGGYLTPLASPAPLEGQALLDFLQAIVVGITELPGNLVRPRWQPEPANVPDAGVAWCAMGINRRTADTYPYVVHDKTGNGSDKMQRHEEMDILCSFYDLGAGGLADRNAALLRDGLFIEQNQANLFLNDFGLIEVGEVLAVPVLFKTRWQYRVDLNWRLRRQIKRTYAVESLESAEIILYTEELDPIDINVVPN